MVSTQPWIPTDLADRFAVIFDWLRKAIAARGGRDRSVTPLVVLVWGRIGRVAQRLDVLLTQFRAGTLPPIRTTPRTRAPRAKSTLPDSPSDPADPPKQRLPRSFGWLGQFVPYARPFGTQLEHVLTDPEMQAFLKAAPQAARLLRPVLWMLGVKPSPDLLPPPPPPSPRRQRTGSAERRSRAANDPTGRRSEAVATALRPPRSKR